jgi:hypothetical protein
MSARWFKAGMSKPFFKTSEGDQSVVLGKSEDIAF